MSAVDKLLAKSGRTRADIPPNTRLGKIIRRRGVDATPEFKRIRDMYRRRWLESPDLPDLIEYLSSEYRRPGVDPKDATLWASQAVCLQEAHDYGHLFAPLPVGQGKTLLSFLLAIVLEAKRPLMFQPKKLVEKTWADAEELNRFWKLDAIIALLEIVSYEKIGVAKGTGFLESFMPDVLICDEVHALKNLRAGRTKKFRRFMEEFPETIFIPLSGTMIDKSLRDFDHLQRWALPPQLRVLPDKWHEVEMWADVLDEKSVRKTAPGALLELCEPGEVNDLSGVRKAFGRRLVETPCVVSTPGTGVNCSLTIEAVQFDDYSEETENAFACLRRWTTPDEWPIPDAIVRWGHACTFANEFKSVWNPRPPRDWLDARREWCKFSRENMSDSDGRFTELDVINACDRGELDSGLLENWREIKVTFTPNVEKHWMGSGVLEWAAAWLENEQGIVWVQHPEVGDMLSEISGFPYFGRQGRSKEAGLIDRYKGGPIIASIKANSEGRNLQDRWSKSLCLFIPGGTKEMEQLIGRLHRPGQKADNVSFQFMVGCSEQDAALRRAFGRSRMSSDTSQQDRKLLIGDYVSNVVYPLRGTPRWPDPDADSP